MDNSKAIDGIYQILSKLTNAELFTLASTVTQGFLKDKVETRKGAVTAILNYSPELQSILKRKIITKDILFSYLHDNKISVTLPATKNVLIDIICSHWNLEFVESPISNNSNNTSNVQPQDIDTLAIKFTEWFYILMNAHIRIEPEHFWNDSKLRLNLLSETQNIVEDINENPEAIVNLLFKTKTEHKLFFNPNFNDNGIQGQINHHGLVIVLVCGTLHSNNACVGIFEQVFNLVRDPFAGNNWKIKNTELNLRNKNDVRYPPRLCESSLSSKLLVLHHS